MTVVCVLLILWHHCDDLLPIYRYHFPCVFERDVFNCLEVSRTKHSSNSAILLALAMNHLKPEHTGSFRCFMVHSFRCAVQGAGAYLNNYPDFRLTHHNLLSWILHVEPQGSRKPPKWLLFFRWPLFGSSHRALPDYHRTPCHGTLYLLRRSRYQISIICLDISNSSPRGVPLRQVRFNP